MTEPKKPLEGDGTASEVHIHTTEKASAAAVEAAANHWREFVTKHPKSQRAKQKRDESHCAETHQFRSASSIHFPNPSSTAAHTQSYTHTHTLTHN